MNTQAAQITAEAEIRALIDSWAKAVNALDTHAIVSHYAPDIVAFDAIGALRFKGVEAYKKHWEACLAMCPNQSAMIFEIHDLNLTVGEDLAFAHALNRCGGTDEQGQEKASWMRMTSGFRRINGQWLIVHEHFSAPFDMTSGKVLGDLKPE